MERIRRKTSLHYRGAGTEKKKIVSRARLIRKNRLLGKVKGGGSLSRNGRDQRSQKKRITWGPTDEMAIKEGKKGNSKCVRGKKKLGG